MERSAALVLLLALGLAPATGCGYRLVRYSGELGDARSVAVEGLVNRTFEPGIDSLLTDALAREFKRRGALQVVTDPESADLRVGGELTGVRTRARSFSSIQFALEYQVTLDVDFRVTDREGSPVALASGGFAESELYLASPDVEATRRNRQEALRRLTNLIAGRLYDALHQREVE